MPLMRRHLLAAGAGVAGGALGALRAPVAFAQPAPKRGGTMVATWGGFEPQALFVPPGGGSSPFFTSTKPLERLLRMDTALAFHSVLAESLEPAADFRSYVIRLRRGATWHDGKDVTADDVLFSLLNYWKPLANGSALRALEGAEALDARSVRLRFNQPVPLFFLSSILAGAGGLLLPKHIYETGDILTNPANNRPIGTGPFKVKEWVRGSHVEYVRNENYWDEGKPYLDRLFIRWWRDPASRLAAFESNAVDIGVFNPVPLPEVDRLVRSGRFTATTSGYENSAWCATIEFNSRRENVNRAQVRHALLHAIDRQLVCDTVFFRRARPGSNPILSANSMFFTDELPKYPFDPAKAAQLLDAAGLPRKRGGRFTLQLLSAGWFEENGRIGQIVKQGLEDVDIRVNLTVPDRPTSFKRIYTDYDYDVAISNYTAPIEPVPVITQFYATDGILRGAAFRNAHGYSSPAMDAIIAELTTETDPAKRAVLARRFSRLAATDLPFLPLVEFDSLTLARSDVRGHSSGANWMGETWSDVWLDR